MSVCEFSMQHLLLSFVVGLIITLNTRMWGITRVRAGRHAGHSLKCPFFFCFPTLTWIVPTDG